MPMLDAMRQKPAQAGRDATTRGEASDGACRGEADGPRHDKSGTGSTLLEAALTRENLQQAFKRVRANKGSAGVDGLDIDQTARMLVTEWPRIRRELLPGGVAGVQPKGCPLCRFGLRPVPSLPSRPFGFNPLTPSRLRRCALRLPPGESPAGYPRRAMLGAPRALPIRLGRIGSAPPHGQGWGGTLGLAAAGCTNACRPQRWRFSPISSRRTVHGHPAWHRYGASTPRLKTGAARRGKGVLACRWGVGLARVSGRAGAAFVRGYRAGHISFWCGSAQGVLVLL